MRASDYISFVIISAELSTLDHVQNASKTMELHNELKYGGFKPVPVTGSYKGVQETSFLILTRDIDTAKTIAKRYKQDSILVRNSWNDCSLVYGDGRVELLGSFNRVTKDEALTEDCWTKLSGEYYIVTKERSYVKN